MKKTVRTTSYLALFSIIEVFYQKGNAFVIPEIRLEAYEPQGLRVSLPVDNNGVQFFAFHGVLNENIEHNAPGTITGETAKRENNVFTFYIEDVKLKVGDVINYWLHVQYNKLGYRKNNQRWTVPELFSLNVENCNDSISYISGRTKICKNDVIFEDKFDEGPISNTKWDIEQYIPHNGPDFEFVSYQRQACGTKRDTLFITPKPEADVEIALDFQRECTRRKESECKHIKHKTFIAPPVISGQIRSKNTFLHGEFNVRAKLPKGDWIYPEIYLEDVITLNRLWIAYVRGNDHLTLANNDDIGATMLFAGPLPSFAEPQRSAYLVSKQNANGFTTTIHTYTVRWEPDQLTFKLDGEEYGKIFGAKLREIGFGQNEMRLVLGVGVGGVNDFPDGVRSGNSIKPWRNKERNQVKNYNLAKGEWFSTWNGDSVALQIEHVRVTAI